MDIIGPAKIWSEDAAPGKEDLSRIRPGGHIQTGARIDGGIDAIWVEVRSVNRNVLDGIIIDGPGRGQSIRFNRRDVWQVL